MIWIIIKREKGLKRFYHVKTGPCNRGEFGFGIFGLEFTLGMAKTMIY